MTYIVLKAPLNSNQPTNLCLPMRKYATVLEFLIHVYINIYTLWHVMLCSYGQMPPLAGKLLNTIILQPVEEMSALQKSLIG